MILPSNYRVKAILLAGLLIVVLIVACSDDPYKLEDLDLSPFDLPITIQAPDSAIVLVKNYDQIRDITIRKGQRYDLQLFEFSPSMNDPGVEKRNQLATVKEAPHFKQILLEEEQGFIFSSQPDSITTRYDFRYIKLVGDKEVIFQTGVSGMFSLEDVQRMYYAVQ